jgi:hypothetical protein
MNKQIREKHKSAWQKGKAWLEQQFAPDGLLPESVFARKIERDAEFADIEFKVEHLVGQLENAVKADYGVKALHLEEHTQRLLSQAIAGEVSQNIPEATKTALLGMRQYIDGLSAQYVAILEKQVAQLQREAQAIQQEHNKLVGKRNVLMMEKFIQSDPIKDKKRKDRVTEFTATVRELRTKHGEIAAKKATIETNMGNVGEYVHRSYQAFDDPEWAKKVPDKVLNEARAYLLIRYAEQEDVSEAEAARRVEVVLNEILKHGTAYETVQGFIHESKLGAKDLSVLMHREKIPAPIRALLGEYTDPRIAFAKTATKLGRLICNQTLLDRVKDVGMGNFLFTEAENPPEATSKIVADASEAYAPLNGPWTPPEVNQAFQDATGKKQMITWCRNLLQFNDMVKGGKKVLSPTTYSKFIISATLTFIVWRLFYPVHWGPNIDMATTILHCLGIAIVGGLVLFLSQKKLGPIKDIQPNITALADLVRQEINSPKKIGIISLLLSPWIFPLLLFLWIVLQTGLQYWQKTELDLVFADSKSGLYVWYGGNDCNFFVLKEFKHKKTIRYETRWEAEQDGFRPSYGCHY